MGKIKKLVALGLVVMASMSFAGCKMIQKTPEAVQKETLAKVGDQKITRQDLTDAMTYYYKQYEQQFGKDYKNNEQVKAQLQAQEKQMLESLVDTKVIVQEAEKNKWVPSTEELDKEVNAQFDKMKTAYKTEDEFKQAYQQSGLKDDAAVKEMLKENIIVKTTLDDHIYKDLKVSDESIKKYYDENKDSFKVDKAGAMIYNIVLPDEKTAEKVRKEILDKSTTFEQAAAKYNTDNTKATGGSLGYVAYDSTQYLPEFMSAAKKLKNGEISQPVKTKYGYHLIKVENVMEKPGIMPLDYVKSDIKDNLLSSEQQKAYTETIKKWKDEIGVKVYEDKLQS